jgi:hypothetical protein
MNSINSKASIHSVYQTQDSNTTSWWLRIIIKHSRWRLISPFHDSNQFCCYLLFQFQKWLCFKLILTTTFRLPIQRNTFPLTMETSKTFILKLALTWSLATVMHFLPKLKDTPSNLAMDLYSTFQPIKMLTLLMRTKSPTVIMST